MLHTGYVMVMRRALPPRLRRWFDVVAHGRTHVPEHHVVMAAKLRRAVDPVRETVHHRNGKRADNRPSNLRLYKRGAHHPGYGDFYQEWQEALTRIREMEARLHCDPPSASEK